MKRVLTLLILLISTFSFSQNFPGESVELLLNKIVKPKVIDESLQKYAYRNFYSKFDTTSKEFEKYKKSHRAFPTSSTLSDYNKLVGKEFKVIKIYDQKAILPSNKGKKFVLELQSDELGTVYYDYNSEYDHDFELEVVGGLQLPEGFYCKDITTTADKFTGVTRSTTEYSEGILLMKTVKDGSSKIYLKINEPGSTLNVGKKGLILLLENGKKIERPNAKIDVEVNSGNYVYSAFIELTDSEIKLLKENAITDNRLYIYDGTIKKGKKIIEYLKCLTK